MALNDLQKAFLSQDLIPKTSVIDPETGAPLDWGALSSSAPHTHAGSDIDSGTVADARLASTLARDSEVTAAISALKNGVGAGGDTLFELDARIAVVEALGSLATDAELIAAVAAILGSADSAGDTLGELQSLIGLRMLKSANLSDLANVATALTNLGFSAFAKTLIDDADAATARATLGLPLNNFAGTVAPTVNEDSGDGYAIGSRWIDTVADKEYVCTDATVGAANWVLRTAGGVAAKLAADAISLGTGGDEFATANGAGWTITGSPTFAAVTDEPYDATCVDFGIVSGSRIHKTLASLGLTDNFEATLTLYGISAAASMIGMGLVDSAGNGTGMSYYNSPSAAWQWAVAGYAYSGSVAGYGTIPADGVRASRMPTVWKIRKVGSTITSFHSIDGGNYFQSNARTDAAVHDRIFISGMFGLGTIRLGRFNFKAYP